MRIIGFQILSRKESLELSTTLAEARALRMETSKFDDAVKGLITLHMANEAKLNPVNAKKGCK